MFKNYTYYKTRYIMSISSKYHSSLKNSIKNLDRTDQWARYLGGGFNDAIVIDDYRVELNDEEQDLRMFIWSRSRPCVNIVLSKEDNVAVMDGVYYNPGCTTSGNMQRGEGTRKMINFAIKYIKSKGAKEIQLSDNSDVPCNGTTVSLGPMYFLKFGQTWYEKHFGFKPLPRYAKQYEAAKLLRQKLLLTLKLQDKPCDYFTDEITNNLLSKVELAVFYKIGWFKKL
jgi:hypothetical protein